MNILIYNWRDIKHPKAGGAEIVTMEHAKYWIKNGHTVYWFSPKFNKSKNLEKIDDVIVYRRGNKLSVYFWAPIFYLFSGLKFDIVIDQIHGIPFFTPFYVRKPKIAFIHEVAKEIWDYMEPFPINTLGKIIEPIYFKFYKTITFWTPSDSTINDLIQMGISKKKCIKILCGINNQTLKSPFKKSKSPIFIFVSRMVMMKGIEDVIDAYSFIVKEKKNSKLWLVGGGEKEYVDILKMKVKNLGIEDSVIFCGFVTEKNKLDLMKKAHILLHASVKEGWGLVVVEAASQSTPSVVYDVAGLRESVKNNITGYVVKENTPEELAKAAIRLFDDKNTYRKFQKNCLIWSSSIKWDTELKKSLNLLNKISKK